MEYHSDCWPGLTALFCDTEEEEVNHCVNLLQQDLCHKLCAESVEGNLFFANLLKLHPLAWEAMTTLADLLQEDGG